MKKTACILLLGFCCSLSITEAQTPESFPPAYIVEDISLPPGLEAETGGLAFLPDGRLAACFTRGEVMFYDPESRQWTLFAEGLHEPLGLWAESGSEVAVMQRPELTRIVDNDGDGKADAYENINDKFGLSGNYHEFNYGPVKGKDGSYYLALNTASSGGGIRANPRGELRLHGRDGETGLRQMFSVVPYRGWVVRISPDGELIPFASGFRSPNGLGWDKEENLFVTDNQSDWVETSALYHVQEGHFYGHPASLVWKEDWDRGSPFDLPIQFLEGMRKKAAVLFPHGIIANSPTQPLLIDHPNFGPFEGQFLIGEMNRERIVRVMLEVVDGQFQGACLPFFDGKGLRKGNNRLAFDSEGNLWVGQIAHGWLGDKGIQKISYTAEPTMEIQQMQLTKNGFRLTFTQPLDEAMLVQPGDFQFTRYTYEYKKKPYDEPVDHSTQSDLQQVQLKSLQLSEDRKSVELELLELKAGYVYEVKLSRILGDGGLPLSNSLICYTLNKLIP